MSFVGRMDRRKVEVVEVVEVVQNKLNSTQFCELLSILCGFEAGFLRRNYV